MGCNTTFKCNPPSLMLISPSDISYSPPSSRSKAHFSQALLDQYSHQQKKKQERSKNSSSASGNNTIGEDQGTKRKKHPCPHDGCPNIYRQKSGLRYHLSHVSLDDLIHKSPPLMYILPGSSECISCSTPGDTTRIGPEDERTNVHVCLVIITGATVVQIMYCNS